MVEHFELEGERLYDALMALKPAHLAETEWALEAGVNRGWFGNLKTKSKNPRRDTLRRVLAYISKTEADLQPGAPPARKPGGRLPAVAADIPATRKVTQGDGSIALTEVDLAFSMGDGSNLDDYVERGTIDFDANLLRTITHSPPHRLFVARGDGDSMMPTLIDNDQVVIDTLQRELKLQDRIWACSIHGAGAIKRLRAIGMRRVLVISDNPTVDNQEVDAEDLRILGRVVWVGRRV